MSNSSNSWSISLSAAAFTIIFVLVLGLLITRPPYQAPAKTKIDEFGRPLITREQYELETRNYLWTLNSRVKALEARATTQPVQVEQQ